MRKVMDERGYAKGCLGIKASIGKGKHFEANVG